MNRFLKVVLALCLSLATISSHAQFGGLTPTGVNAAFFKLFDQHTSFSADVDARVLDKQGKDWIRVPLTLAVLDQKIVMDVDISKAVSRDLPEFALTSLKDCGMAQVVSITRPDKKATFLVYPGAESYVSIPLSAEESQALDKGYKVETKAIGKESLAGKERAKNTVLVRDSKGASVLEATTWNAPELKNFPVQIETQQDKMTVILRFTNIKLQKPDAAQFEISAKFTQYKDVQEMMLAMMKKIASGALK